MRKPLPVALGASLLLLPLSGDATAQAPRDRWRPVAGPTWQWQLSGVVDTSVDAEVYNIDLFENGAALVDELHAAGRHVICYLSAGSFERWRSDAARFPDSVKGRSNGWAGERWLDIRRLSVLKPIMRDRLDKCRARGYDGVEFDNVDGFENHTGFRLSRSDQRTYNLWLAKAAHERGLAAGLKNDLSQVEVLEPAFDFAVNEQCFQYRECGVLRAFTDADKPVFHVEYRLERAEFCDRAVALGFSSMRKGWDLTAWQRPC